MGLLFNFSIFQIKEVQGGVAESIKGTLLASSSAHEKGPILNVHQWLRIVKIKPKVTELKILMSKI